jgi:glyoxylate carboligase
MSLKMSMIVPVQGEEVSKWQVGQLRCAVTPATGILKKRKSLRRGRENRPRPVFAKCPCNVRVLEFSFSFQRDFSFASGYSV